MATFSLSERRGSLFTALNLHRGVWGEWWAYKAQDFESRRSGFDPESCMLLVLEVKIVVQGYVGLGKETSVRASLKFVSLCLMKSRWLKWLKWSLLFICCFPSKDKKKNCLSQCYDIKDGNRQRQIESQTTDLSIPSVPSVS